MAHNQSENSRDKSTDESGDMTPRTEDPLLHGTVTEATTKNGEHDMTRKGHGSDGIHGTTGTRNGTHGTATGPTGFSATTAGGHGFPIDHRPESLSSVTSSEVNGKEKIQESLPGVNSDQSGTNTPPFDTSAHEKKGVKENIKERLPGGNSDHSGTNTPPIDTRAHEKKGMEEKSKEKLPGGVDSDHSTTSHAPPNDTNSHENKGMIDKIKEYVKFPGHRPQNRSN